MAGNGFVQKWVGKVLAKALWIGTGGIVIAGSTGNVNVTQTQIANLANNAALTAYTSAVAANVSNSGIGTVSLSSAAVVFTLDAPVANSNKLLTMLSISSGVFFKSTGATFDGTNVVMKSTVAGSIRLRGLSTSRWAIEGIFPGSTIASSILTFSATT